MAETEQSRLASLAINCASTRRAYQAARKALKAFREQNGGCTELNGEYGVCYQSNDALAEWCPACQGAQPLYLERVKAGDAAGRAFRALLAACKRAQNEWGK